MGPTKKSVKEEEKGVPSVSKKRAATGPAPKILEKVVASTSKNDAVASKVAPPKTVKAGTVLKVGKTMEPKDVVRKFLDFLEAVMAKQDRDDSYNKLKLQEVTATLDLMSRPTVMRSVPEFVVSEDAPNLINMLLDGLGESTKHGNKMVYAVMKSVLIELRDNERVSKSHASRVIKELNNNLEEMTPSNNMYLLEHQQMFWKTLFEHKKFASQLPSLATDHVDGITYDDLPEFGQVQIVVKAASSLGDNFMSDTFTITAKLTRCGTTFQAFTKVLPSNLVLRQAAYESHTHHHEMHMYLHFFSLLRDMYAGQQIPLDIPDIYYVDIEEIIPGETDGSGTCIVLEDLSTQGYCMSDKFGGADFQHCHMALTSLAHYHALTMSALRRWKDPATGELSNIPPTAKFLMQEKTVYEVSAVQIARDFSKKMIEFAQDVKRPDLAKWLTHSIDERLSEVILVDTTKSCGPMACILHGDFWNNNMLFKYADVDDNAPQSTASPGIPVSLKLIDFQMSRIGHPLTDILYFLNASAKPEVREQHMEKLLRLYHDTLTADLQQLDIPLDHYTFQDFLDDYKKRSLMGLFFGGLIMSMGLAKAVVSTMQKLDKEEQLKEPISVTSNRVTNAQPDDFSGKSSSFEETIKNMMSSHKLSDNPILTDRLLRLIIQVHTLNTSS